MIKAAELYQACLSTEQQKSILLNNLIVQGTRNLSDDEHIIELKFNDHIQRGWYCNFLEKE